VSYKILPRLFIQQQQTNKSLQKQLLFHTLREV